MITIQRLSDFDNPVIQKKAEELTSGKQSQLEKLQSIFYFVRDEIKFGFPPKWDEMKASEVISCGLGYCNTKATLFHALCQAVQIPSRIHFASIDLQIMYGIFPSIIFPLLPKEGGHSWVEVNSDGKWNSIDSYINDKNFYKKALEKLKASDRNIGYSISFIDGKSSCEFNFGDKGFVHMGAVVEDHDTWEDASDYFASDKYLKLEGFRKKFFLAITKIANRNIERIRTNLS